nr:proline iminopeptidase [Gammaproteobacteria bacterium]
NEFLVIGNLKDWDRVDRLADISIPTLITVGRYDEITPACAKTMHQRIAGSQLVVFEQSSHTAHIEEEARYREVVGDFLHSVES